MDVNNSQRQRGSGRYNTVTVAGSILKNEGESLREGRREGLERIKSVVLATAWGE